MKAKLENGNAAFKTEIPEEEVKNEIEPEVWVDSQDQWPQSSDCRIPLS